jgi:hypothetical protein
MSWLDWFYCDCGHAYDHHADRTPDTPFRGPCGGCDCKFFTEDIPCLEAVA